MQYTKTKMSPAHPVEPAKFIHQPNLPTNHLLVNQPSSKPIHLPATRKLTNPYKMHPPKTILHLFRSLIHASPEPS